MKISPQMITALKTYLRAFLAVILAMFIADGADLFSIGVADLRLWTAAGLASVLPVVIRALDTTDEGYGLRPTPALETPSPVETTLITSSTPLYDLKARNEPKPEPEQEDDQ